MPTNAEIFAGPNSGLNNHNLLQVAKNYRNIEIVAEFNRLHDTDHIVCQTIGARISRGLDRVARRDGLDRQALNAAFQAERKKNGVAGENQHTKVLQQPKTTGRQKSTRSQTSTVQAAPIKGQGSASHGNDDSDAYAAASSPAQAAKERSKRKTTAAASRDGDERRDSVVSATATTSPASKKSSGQTPATSPSTSAAGTKRKANEVGDAREPASQEGERPQKKGKTDAASGASSTSSQKSGGKDSGRATPSRAGKEVGGGTGGSSPSTNGSRKKPKLYTPSPAKQSVLSEEEEDESSPSATTSPAAAAFDPVRDFHQELDEAEADNIFSDTATIHDDRVLELASELTVPEIVRMANRGARRNRHTPASVTRRISAAVPKVAERRGRSSGFIGRYLQEKRRENGLSPGGQRRFG